MRSFEDDIERALATSFLARLPRKLADELVESSTIREVPAGREFASAAEPLRFGILVRGLARVYVVRPHGEQVIVRRAAPGAALGMGALIGARFGATIQAVTDCEILRLDAGLVLRLARTRPEVAMAIVQELGQRIGELLEEMQRPDRAAVHQKVAVALLDRAVDGDPPEVAITQESLAESVGASRESVGRVLRALGRAGAIRLERGRVVLVDPVALERSAHERRLGPASSRA